MNTSEYFKCGDALSDGVQCSACSNQFYFQCAGITEAGYRKLGDRKSSWRCVACKQAGVTGPSPTGMTTATQQSDSNILAELRALSAKLVPLESLAEDLKALRSEFAEMRSSLSQYNEKVADFEKRLLSVEKVQTQYKDVDDRLCKLEDDAKTKEQWSRMNNAEVKDIAEVKNEDLYDVVAKLGAKVNFTIDKNHINFIHRVPTRDTNQAKPIIICFNNRHVKENFVAAARIANKETPLTTSSLGLKGNNKIFVNDHLTTVNKNLLSKAKSKANEQGFLYVWVKHAKIHLRKEDGSPIILVKNEKDLSKII